MMNDNITKIEMINLREYIKKVEEQLNNIVENSTYSELIKYIEILPKEYESEEALFFWGFSYLNEYYKIIGKLDNINTPEIEDLKYKIYILYLKENFNRTVLNFEEFKTFGKLMNVAFSNYNPNKIRKRDKELYKSDNEEIDNIVNKVANDVLHSPNPHAYEVTKFQLKTLLNILNKKRDAVLKEEFSKINLDDTLLNKNLSKERIKKLKKKIK